MSRTTIRREIAAKLNPQRVWDLLQDPRLGPFWRAELGGTVRYSLKVEQRAWRQSSSGSKGWVFEQTEAEAPRRLVLTSAGERGAVWTFELEPVGDGTVLRLSAEFETGFSLGFLFGGLSPEQAANRLMDELAARLY
jgi:uncharacterized protein YndB with AHSA1/START domain